MRKARLAATVVLTAAGFAGMGAGQAAAATDGAEAGSSPEGVIWTADAWEVGNDPTGVIWTSSGWEVG
jgi:hypothetical protein